MPATIEDAISVSVEAVADDAPGAGTATIGGDASDDVFPIADQTVVFNAGLGSTSVGFSATARSDSSVEGTETVEFELDPSPAYVGVGDETLDVTDAQSASVGFNITQASALEDSQNNNTFVSVILSLPQGGTCLLYTSDAADE